MNFIVSAQALSKQLARIAGAIPTRSVLPIIENFLFEVNDSTLTLSTTNLETSMQTSMEVEARGEGIKVAIPARILTDMLKKLPEQPITFMVNEDTFGVEITSQNGTYKISGENGEDFPAIPRPDGAQSVSLPLFAMFKAINRTIFAASSDEDKAALNGIFFDLGEHGATFVATDAHRLVRYRRVDVTTPERTTFIVPQKALGLLKNSLDPSSNKDVIVHYTESNAFFQTEDLLLACRLIDQKYPDYESVIPSNNPNKLFVSRNDLLGSLGRVNIFANKSTHQVRFSVKESGLEISCEDPDFANEARESIKCHYEGSDLDIGFNAALLLEVISHLETDDVIMELSEPSRAGIILPNEQEDGESILMLVMPIMLTTYA
ncbi:MAG: DNA polymerase III subunit beta [Bacteroidia bacterium]